MAVEEVYGDVFMSEEQCPGVYYLACRRNEDERPSELVVVELDCPHISAMAKAYGKPLDGHDDLLVYDYTAKRGGSEIVIYEAHRYLKLHGLPIPDQSTLLSSAAYFADDYPEYFGAIPAPVVTPRGCREDTRPGILRFLMAFSRLKRIPERGLPLLRESSVRDTTIQLGMKVENPAGFEVPVEVQHLFFTEENGCLALFELLLTHDALLTSTRLDKQAPMNAIWRYHPGYALRHNLQEQRGLNDLLGLLLNDVGIECKLCGSANNMVTISPETGTGYICW